MAQRLNPAARDAAISRIAMITTGVVILGLAGTVGLGVAIAAETPVKKNTAVTGGYGQVAPAPNAQGKVAPAPKPQASTQAPDTTSGGS